MKNVFLIMTLPFLCFSVFAQIPRYQQITSAEYFVNTDPGEGNGTSISGNFGFWEVGLSVSNVSLPVDAIVYIRAKNSQGIWSAPRGIKRQIFYNNSGASLTYGEYYINSDPGFNNGNPIEINSGVFELKKLLLKRGDNIYVRVKDNFNRWSPSRCIKYNFKDLTKAEYYVKKFAGDTSQLEPMIISTPSDSQCVFIAYSYNINFSVKDTFYVRFQTEDKFTSNWTIGPLADPYFARLEKYLLTEFTLSQNFPNPFNPITKIRFTIPLTSPVKLEIFNTLGQRVGSLIDKELSGGSYEYNWNAAGYTSGIYIYRVQAGGAASQRKMILLK
ncbi:MAG: T9SS type A sorting domain-containing protein [Ignavibacteriales bacterium]|nr:T9SS type A sorting domain-containing protein [Ignavibacteriales bacterium]